MSDLVVWKKKNLTRGERRRLRKEMKRMDTIRIATLYAIRSISETDREVAELVMKTFEATEFGFTNGRRDRCRGNQEAVEQFIEDYLATIREIVGEHHEAVLRELNRFGLTSVNGKADIGFPLLSSGID